MQKPLPPKTKNSEAPFTQWAVVAGLLVMSVHAQAEQRDPASLDSATATGQSVLNGEHTDGADSSPKWFSLDGVTAASSDFRHADDPEHTAAMRYSLLPSIKLSRFWTLSASVNLDEDLTGLQGWRMEDSLLRLSTRPLQVAPALDLVPSFSVVVPTSKDAYHDKGMYGGLGLANRFEFAGERIGASRLILRDSVSGTYYQYRYDTSTSGVSNPVVRLGNSFQSGYQLTPPLSVLATFNSNTFWTSLGTPASYYVLAEEADYDLSKRWSLGLGHANSANYYKDNGADSNFSVFNGNSSTFFGTMTFSY